MLVVDDTPVNLTVFTNLLNRSQMTIDTCESGDEAVELYKNKHYDVIFLDHMMPNKDGIETLNEMHGLQGTPNDQTPVVCLTANAISGMREMYINAGFDDYITKPINPDRLEGTLLKFLPKDKVSLISDDGESESEDYDIPEFLYHIDEIDVEAGIDHCGNGESYIATLKTYLDTVTKNADDIEMFWKAGDIRNITTKVHALKSTSKVIGALELGEFAETLEEAGKQGDMEMLDRELPKLLSDYRKLAGDLEPLHEHDVSEEDDRPPITLEELNEAYKKLLDFGESFDFDSMVDIVESLGQYSIPEDEAMRVAAIIKAADDLDYEMIPDIINGSYLS